MSTRPYKVTIKMPGLEFITIVESETQHAAKAQAIGKFLIKNQVRIPAGTQYEIEEFTP